MALLTPDQHPQFRQYRPPHQGWAVCAYRHGQWKQLTPDPLPFATSRDEALERARILCKIDPLFRRRYHHYFLVPVRFDDAVLVDRETGVMKKDGHL